MLRRMQLKSHEINRRTPFILISIFVFFDNHRNEFFKFFFCVAHTVASRWRSTWGSIQQDCQVLLCFNIIESFPGTRSQRFQLKSLSQSQRTIPKCSFIIYRIKRNTQTFLKDLKSQIWSLNQPAWASCMLLIEHVSSICLASRRSDLINFFLLAFYGEVLSRQSRRIKLLANGISAEHASLKILVNL